PSLFGGEGGKGAARFVERWAMMTVYAPLGGALLMDIHETLAERDRDYFRQSRQARYGDTLENVAAGRDARVAAMRDGLAPLRKTLEMQPFLGGSAPLFPDYIVAGAFQWARIVTAQPVLA